MCWSRRNPWTRVFSPAEQRDHGVDVDVGGVGAEAIERFVRLGVTRHHPHAGLALGAGLGEQERPPVGEGPPGLTVAGLGRLLLVGLADGRPA